MKAKSISQKNKFQNLYILACIFFLITIVSYFIYWTSDSSKIRRTINSGRKSIERKNLELCLSFFSKNYYDSAENTYDEIAKILDFLFLKINTIKIRIKKINLKIRGNEASAEIHGTISMTIGKQKIFLGSKNVSPVYLFFRREDDKWKIISVEGIDFTIKEFL